MLIFLNAVLPALMLLGAATADSGNFVYFSNWTVANTFQPLAQIVGEQYNYEASTYNLNSTTTTMSWTPNSVEMMVAKLCNATDYSACDADTSLIPNTFICDNDTTTAIPNCGASQTLSIPDFRSPSVLTFPAGVSYIKLSIKAYDSVDNNGTAIPGYFTSYILGIDNIGGTQPPTTTPPNSTLSPTTSSATTTSVPTTSSASATTRAAAGTTAAPATQATPTTVKPTNRLNAAKGVAPVVLSVLGLVAAALAVMAQ